MRWVLVKREFFSFKVWQLGVWRGSPAPPVCGLRRDVIHGTSPCKWRLTASRRRDASQSLVAEPLVLFLIARQKIMSVNEAADD